MPPPRSSESRTNSLAFAKTDCHTCTANQRRCDRKRPRCSSCSGINIVCGGYPMQLKWSKTKSMQLKAPMFSKQTDDPFYLDPLSLRASIHLKDRNTRSQPHKPRRFRFVAEAPGRKQTSIESCETRIQRSSANPDETQARPFIQPSNIAIDRSIHQSTPCTPWLGTLDDGIHGKETSYSYVNHSEYRIRHSCRHKPRPRTKRHVRPICNVLSD